MRKTAQSAPGSVYPRLNVGCFQVCHAARPKPFPNFSQKTSRIGYMFDKIDGRSHPEPGHFWRDIFEPELIRFHSPLLSGRDSSFGHVDPDRNNPEFLLRCFEKCPGVAPDIQQTLAAQGTNLQGRRDPREQIAAATLLARSNDAAEAEIGVVVV